MSTSSTFAPWEKEHSGGGGGLKRTVFGFDNVLAQWYYLFGGLGEPNVGFLVTLPPAWLGEGEDCITKRIEKAWLATLVEIPDLACTFVSTPSDQDPLAGLQLNFSGLTNDSEVKGWLDNTLNVKSSFTSLDALRFSASTEPLLGQMNVPHSYPIQLTVGLAPSSNKGGKVAFFLRSNHILFDGPGCLSILNCFFDNLVNSTTDQTIYKSVVEKVSPSSATSLLRLHALDVLQLPRKEYDEAQLDPQVGQKLMESKIGLPLNSDYAGKTGPWPTNAPPTEALHLILSTPITAAFLAQCKSRGLTATYGLGAALLTSGFELFREKGDEDHAGPIEAAILVIFNLRKWMNPPSGVKRTASSAETSVLSTTSTTWDQATAKGLTGQERNKEVFWTFAKDLEKFFSEHVESVSSFAGKGAHEFWKMYNGGAVAMATGQIPTVPSTGFGLNSVGVIENFIKSSFESKDGTIIELHESLFAMRAASIVTQPHIWTFRNQLHVNMSYVKQMFVPGTPQKLAERLMANVAMAAGGSADDVKVFHEQA